MSIIKEICQRRGWSKYKIAKEIGVSWNTVHLWDKEVWAPNKKNSKRLKELLNEHKIETKKF